MLELGTDTCRGVGEHFLHPVTGAEFKRWLERHGASVELAKGGPMRVFLGDRRAILPMHDSRKEMKRGTVPAMKKQRSVVSVECVLIRRP